MRGLSIALAAAVAAFAVSSPAEATHKPRSKAKHTWQKPAPRAERDCVPINGRYGYYGNPWCDTGSSRPPDIEFRERQRLQKQR
ncbi:hypothetical protein [Hyphomicrobium sp. 802]|uniref:hypothetical protein n=1 Tax=Hyphomicrobium sp. 802 TaxID=1112272 RepID=UPI00045E6744|nr:hypothetical protein [Hyphomicrobium sp. 802]